MFDTLAYVKRLTAAGIPRHQAEAFCEVLLMALEDTLAERDPEMARLRFENEILRHRCRVARRLWPWELRP